MAVLTIPQCAYVWEQAGGSRRHVVVAVAVATAESGRNTTAVSPTADYGLWQINAGNFGWLGLTVSTALEAGPNAQAAVRMSGDGANWAAWCTCWVDPAADCGHGSLPYPQRGSPAYSQIDAVAQALGQNPPAPPPPGGGGGGGEAGAKAAQDALTAMIDEYKRYNNTSLRGHARWHRNIAQVVREMVR